MIPENNLAELQTAIDGDVRTAYSAMLKQRKIKNLVRLTEATGTQPQFTDEEVQTAYESLLKTCKDQLKPPWIKPRKKVYREYVDKLYNTKTICEYEYDNESTLHNRGHNRGEDGFSAYRSHGLEGMTENYTRVVNETGFLHEVERVQRNINAPPGFLHNIDHFLDDYFIETPQWQLWKLARLTGRKPSPGLLAELDINEMKLYEFLDDTTEPRGSNDT